LIKKTREPPDQTKSNEYKDKALSMFRMGISREIQHFFDFETLCESELNVHITLGFSLDIRVKESTR